MQPAVHVDPELEEMLINSAAHLHVCMKRTLVCAMNLLAGWCAQHSARSGRDVRAQHSGTQPTSLAVIAHQWACPVQF